MPNDALILDCRLEGRDDNYNGFWFSRSRTVVLKQSHPKAKPRCKASLNRTKIRPYFTHMKMLTALRI